MKEIINFVWTGSSTEVVLALLGEVILYRLVMWLIFKLNVWMNWRR